MSRLSRYPLFCVFLALGLLLGACNMPTRTPTPSNLPTIAALTANAQLTIDTQLTERAPSNTLQNQATATEETSAPPEPTNTPEPTDTPKPTDTPEPTATEIPCNHVDFGDPIDVTVPDDTEFSPGDNFTKTWRLKNGGSCPWTSGYQLVFVNGDQMGAQVEQQLTSGTIEPGQEIEVSVDLVAPEDPGEYRGYFKLREPGGVLFGWGDENKAFWVDIKVHGVMLDFIAGAEDAEWGTGVKPVDFAGPGHIDIEYGGPDSDSDGFAMVKSEVKLENGKKSGKILETHPKWENDGYIVGRYPAYDVIAGDRLTGKLGFIAMSDGSCGTGEVEFRIYYTIGGDMGTRTKLDSWDETCDGDMKKIDIDLDFLKGKSVEFYLVVLADGTSAQDWAVWDSLGVVR